MSTWQPANLEALCPAGNNFTACSSFGFLFLNLLVQLYGDSEDSRIQRKLKEEGKYKDVDRNGEVYDFIIVGAGAAGAVVANRLTEVKKWKVLLLEAGHEQPDVSEIPTMFPSLTGSSIDWAYTTMPNGKSCLAFDGRCGWPKGKTMGGSTTINSLAYIRGNKLDYDHWAELGNDGWSYRDVLPYFKKSENNMNIEGLDSEYHARGGIQAVSRFPYIDQPTQIIEKGFRELGLPEQDSNADKQDGTLIAQAFSKDGKRYSVNEGYIRPIRYTRKNLIVKTEAEVTKVLIKNYRAYGVQSIRNGKMYTAKAKKEVIVSGGPIQSPKLLMLSGIGPKEHLEELYIPVIKNLAVGENLHDHVTFNGMMLAFPNTTNNQLLYNKETALRLTKEWKNLQVKGGPLSLNGAVSSVTFIRTDPSLAAPDIQFQSDSSLWEEYIQDPPTYNSVNKIPANYYTAVLPRAMNLTPKSRGYIHLNASDPHGKPLIYVNYLDDPEDLIPIKKGIRFFMKLEHTKAFKEAGAYMVKKNLPGCEQYKWGSDEALECLIRRYTSTTQHPVGTCKMGPKCDPKAVVDPKLKVYGISGLRVIDSSIMPQVNRGNTQAPSMMIGEKGADLIKEDWLAENSKYRKNSLFF